MTASFDRMTTTTASTKRNPAPASGKVGAPVTKISSLKIFPLMPASKEIVEKYRLSSPRDAYVTYTAGAPDVLEGDTLTVAGVDYRIKGVSPWPGSQAYIELVVEKVQGT